MKIVIIGGGFAGLQLAKTLNNKNKKVIVLDRMNHHMFQPLFYQVASGRIEPSNISFPFRKIFQQSRNTQFRMTEVKEIDPANNKVITDEAEFTYDKLIIATGCKTNFFGNKDLETSSIFLLLVDIQLIFQVGEFTAPQNLLLPDLQKH